MSLAVRKKKHQQGCELMARGEHLKALDILTCAYNDHGSYILLLGDIIACHYVLGQHLESSYYLQKYQGELESVEHLLSAQVLAKAYTFLGKVQEEQALLTEAWVSYQKAYQNFESPWCRIQLLRFQAVYGIGEDVESLYLECKLIEPTNESEFFETQHALLLTELYLFGYDTAFKRLESLLSHLSIQKADARLAYFDFLEFVLQKYDRENIDEDVNELEQLKIILGHLSFDDLDPFETSLERILMDADYELNPTELDRLSKVISPLSYFRLSRLAGKIKEKKSGNQLRNKAFASKYGSASAKNLKLIWSQWRPGRYQSNSILIYVCIKSGQCTFEGKTKVIKPNLVSMKIIKALANNRCTKTDEFVRDILEKYELNEYSYDAAKKAVSRVNLLLLELTGFIKAVNLDKRHMTLASEVQIIIC